MPIFDVSDGSCPSGLLSTRPVSPYPRPGGSRVCVVKVRVQQLQPSEGEQVGRERMVAPVRVGAGDIKAPVFQKGEVWLGVGMQDGERVPWAIRYLKVALMLLFLRPRLASGLL